MGETAFGIVFSKETTPGAGTYTPLADIMDVTPPQYSADTYEDTDHGDSDGYKTYIGGLKDAGEATIELSYNQTSHNALIDDLGDLIKYKITFPRAADNTCIFNAIMTGFTAQTPREEKQTATVTLKVTGKPAWSTV